MFETLVDVERWQQQLSAALTAPSGLDDRALVDQIRALEELVCTATAAQAALSAELESSVRARHRAAGGPTGGQGRGIAAQVAYARRESPHRAQRHLGLATIVRSELPLTWHAWSTGRITEWTATLVARETACLTLEDRRSVDAEIAADPDALERRGPSEVAGLCAAAAARLDPASVVERRRRAEADRHVTLRPAPDTMTRLSALLPVTDGVAVLAVLSKAADAARAVGDPRSRGQVMADTLVDRVLERARQATTSPSGVGVDLGLVMTDASLFGDSDDPAHLTGYGPIPAELAREIMAHACTTREDLWLRRLYTSPTTGELLTMDTRARRFLPSLARFIRLRDQVCRTPWCHAPVRHTDHAHDAAGGGATSAANGQGLSARRATTPNKHPDGTPGPSPVPTATRSRPPCPPGTTTAPTPHLWSASTASPHSTLTSCSPADRPGAPAGGGRRGQRPKRLCPASVTGATRLGHGHTDEGKDCGYSRASPENSVATCGRPMAPTVCERVKLRVTSCCEIGELHALRRSGHLSRGHRGSVASAAARLGPGGRGTMRGADDCGQ